MRLIYRRSDQVYDDVILGAAEIGVVAYPQPRAGVDILPFRDDRLAVVFAPGHPLASKTKVSLTALAGRALHRLRSRGSHPEGARPDLPREGRRAASR